MQLGIRQARYVGRSKTLFQLMLAAAVANLTLLAGAIYAPGAIFGFWLALWSSLMVLRSSTSEPERLLDLPNRPSPTDADHPRALVRKAPLRPGF